MMSACCIIQISPEALEQYVSEAIAARVPILVAEFKATLNEFQAKRVAENAQYMAETEALIEARLAPIMAESEARLVQHRAKTDDRSQEPRVDEQGERNCEGIL